MKLLRHSDYPKIYILSAILLGSLLSFSITASAAENCNNLMPPKSELIWVDVEYALTGDTLAIQNKKVRLIGLDAPQKERKQKFHTPGEPMAKESQTFLNKLLANNDLKVGILYDKTKTDKFGRQLVYAFLEDGTNIQQKVLEAGFALYKPEFDNLRFAKCFIEAEKKARDGSYQLWDLSQKNPELHYPLIQSSKIYAEDEGFRIIRGKIERVSKSSSMYQINMDTTGIRIPKRAWKNFDYSKIQKLPGKTVEARGFVYHYKGAMYMIVESPYAIDTCAQEHLKLQEEARNRSR